MILYNKYPSDLHIRWTTARLISYNNPKIFTLRSDFTNGYVQTMVFDKTPYNYRFLMNFVLSLD